MHNTTTSYPSYLHCAALSLALVYALMHCRPGGRAGLAGLSRLLPGAAASAGPRFDIGMERPLDQPDPEDAHARSRGSASSSSRTIVADTVYFPDEFLWGCRTAAAATAMARESKAGHPGTSSTSAAASPAAAAVAVPESEVEAEAATSAPPRVSAGLMAAAFGGGGGLIPGYGSGFGGGGAGLAGAVELAGVGIPGLPMDVGGSASPTGYASPASFSLTSVFSTSSSSLSVDATRAIAELIQKRCTAELERFATPLHENEAVLAAWRQNATATQVSAAARCGMLSKVGTQRVLHKAIEQAWAGADAAASAGLSGSGGAVGESAASSALATHAEAAVTLEWCKALPKVELHAHLNGSLDAPALKALLAHPANANSSSSNRGPGGNAELMAKVQIAENERLAFPHWCSLGAK